MVVPEQHHALDQRLVGRQHLLDPPVAQFAPLLLDRPRDLQGLAVDAGIALRLGALGLGHLLPLAQGGGPLANPGRWRRDRLAAIGRHHTVDRRDRILRGEGFDGGRRAAKSGSRQEVARSGKTDRRGAERGARLRQGGRQGGDAAAHEATPTDRSPHRGASSCGTRSAQGPCGCGSSDWACWRIRASRMLAISRAPARSRDSTAWRITFGGVQAGQLGCPQCPVQPSGLVGQFLAVPGRERGQDEVVVAAVAGWLGFRGPDRVQGAEVVGAGQVALPGFGRGDLRAVRGA